MPSKQNSDSIFENHYKYLKHVIKDVIQIEAKHQDEFNYCIYLLDRDYLPQNDKDVVSWNNFFLTLGYYHSLLKWRP